MLALTPGLWRMSTGKQIIGQLFNLAVRAIPRGVDPARNRGLYHQAIEQCEGMGSGEIRQPGVAVLNRPTIGLLQRIRGTNYPCASWIFPIFRSRLLGELGHAVLKIQRCVVVDGGGPNLHVDRQQRDAVGIEVIDGARLPPNLPSSNGRVAQVGVHRWTRRLRQIFHKPKGGERGYLSRVMRLAVPLLFRGDAPLSARL